MKKGFDITKHVLVPKHVKLNDKEKNKLLETYNISIKELPRILKNDPAIANLKAKEGDVIKIVRKSLTVNETVFYRGVMSG